MRRTELRSVIPAERRRLVRDLRSLSSDEWDRDSLCKGWRVRDVVGHLIRNDEVFRRGYPFLVDLLRAGFRPQAALADAARRRAEGRSPEELTDRLDRTRQEIGVRIHPSPAVPLGELLIHGQDIRRALGRPCDVPPGLFGVVADGTLTFVRRLFGWGAAPKGVRFEASDDDWSYGQGEAVRGRMEAIAMVLAGRRSAIGDLEGPGIALL